MNYTRPGDEDHTDTPQDWLNGALTFARALSLILKETEGIIVNVEGDVNFGENINRVIVYKKDKMVHIDPCEDALAEGTLVWVSDINMN